MAQTTSPLLPAEHMETSVDKSADRSYSSLPNNSTQMTKIKHTVPLLQTDETCNTKSPLTLKKKYFDYIMSSNYY